MCVCLLIVLVCAGALFFIGWTQFRVAADSVGVVSSKTGGVAAEVVRPGVFSWHWEFLIPTNAALQTFRVHPYSFRPQVAGSLPSAGDYSAALKGRPDFSYQFDFEIQLAVQPESLPRLVRQSLVSDQQSLEAYLSAAADALAKSAAAIFLDGGTSAPLPSGLSAAELAAAAGAVVRRFPEVEVLQFSVVSARLPDWELYQTARRLYLSDSRARQEPAPPPAAEPEELREPELSEGDRQALELLRQLKSLMSEEKA